MHSNKFIGSWNLLMLRIYLFLLQDDSQDIWKVHLAIAHRAVQAWSVYSTLLAWSVTSTPAARARQLTVVLPIWTDPGPQFPLLCNRCCIPVAKKSNLIKCQNYHSVWKESKSATLVLSKVLMACTTTDSVGNLEFHHFTWTIGQLDPRSPIHRSNNSIQNSLTVRLKHEV